MLRAIIDVAILADHARVLNLLERLPPPLAKLPSALASALILILPDVLGNPNFAAISSTSSIATAA